MDPTFDLSLVLTAAGVPVASGIIAALIQILKRLPVFGSVLGTATGARSANILLCAVLVVYAAVATKMDLTPVSGFMLFLAWVNLVGFTDKAYEIAPDGVKSVLGG